MILISISDHPEEDICNISGTQARTMIKEGKQPPEWFMRPEISKLLLAASKSGKKVFVD